MCIAPGVPARDDPRYQRSLEVAGQPEAYLAERFRHRPLGEASLSTFVSADALTMEVREGGRVI